MTAPKCLNVALDNRHSAVVRAMRDANGDPRPRSANGIAAIAHTLDHAGSLFLPLAGHVARCVRVFAQFSQQGRNHRLECIARSRRGHFALQSHC